MRGGPQIRVECPNPKCDWTGRRNANTLHQRQKECPRCGNIRVVVRSQVRSRPRPEKKEPVNQVPVLHQVLEALRAEVPMTHVIMASRKFPDHLVRVSLTTDQMSLIAHLCQVLSRKKPKVDALGVHPALAEMLQKNYERDADVV